MKPAPRCGVVSVPFRPLSHLGSMTEFGLGLGWPAARERGTFSSSSGATFTRFVVVDAPLDADAGGSTFTVTVDLAWFAMAAFMALIAFMETAVLFAAAFLFEVVFFFFFWCGAGCTAIGSVLVDVAGPLLVSIVTSVWLPFCWACER